MKPLFLVAVVVLFFHTAYCSPTDSASCSYRDSLHLPECNGAPLSSIDTLKSKSLIAKHLIRYTQHIDQKERPCSTSIDLLVKRYKTFSDTTTFPIDTGSVRWLGNSSAPVSVIMYISMSCPHCKQVYKELYDTLHVNQSLQNVMRLGIKYRAKSRYDKVLCAAGTMGDQHAFLRRCADKSERLNDEMVKTIAARVKIPYDKLMQNAYLPDNVKAVERSRQEGIDNGVEYTPALFINNRRYHSTKTAPWILDAVDYFARESSKTR